MLDEVRKWLTTQGFSLEMRTASAFREAGFEVQLSSLFKDHETKKSREIDVIALHPDFVGMLKICFVIECKSSKKPWVLMCSNLASEGLNRLFAFAPSTAAVKKILMERLYHFIGAYPWLKKEGLIGYSFRQAFSDQDPAYAAALSVAKASDHLISGIQGVAPLRIVFPIIVIDSPLVQCSVSSGGEMELTQIEEGEFVFRADPPKDFLTCIRVVTIERLRTFAIEAKEIADRLRADLGVEIRDAWKRAFPESDFPEELTRLNSQRGESISELGSG